MPESDEEFVEKRKRAQSLLQKKRELQQKEQNAQDQLTPTMAAPSPSECASKSFSEKFSQMASPDKDGRTLSARRDANKWEALASPRTPRSEQSVEDVVERLVELDEREVVLERDVNKLIQNQEKLVQMVDQMRNLVIAAASPTAGAQSPLSVEELRKENESLKRKVEELKSELDKQASPAKGLAREVKFDESPKSQVDTTEQHKQVTPPNEVQKEQPKAKEDVAPPSDEHKPSHPEPTDDMKKVAHEFQEVLAKKPPPPPPPKKPSTEVKALHHELKASVEKHEQEKAETTHHKALPAVHEELLKKVEEEKHIKEEKADSVRKINSEISEAVKERKPPPPPPPKPTAEQSQILKELKSTVRDAEQKKAVEHHKEVSHKLFEELEKKIEEHQEDLKEKEKLHTSMKDVMKEMEEKVKSTQSHLAEMYTKPPEPTAERKDLFKELEKAVEKKEDEKCHKEHKEKMDHLQLELQKKQEEKQKELESKKEIKTQVMPKLTQELLEKASKESDADHAKVLQETERHMAEKNKLQLQQSIIEEKNAEREEQFHNLLLEKANLEKKVEELEKELRKSNEELRHSNVKIESLKKKLSTANELQTLHVKKIEELSAEIESLKKGK